MWRCASSGICRGSGERSSTAATPVPARLDRPGARGGHPDPRATFLHGEATRAAADGHTTGYQAGEVATQAEVKRLILCHFAAHLHGQEQELCQEAMRAYDGPVEIPEEFREYRV